MSEQSERMEITSTDLLDSDVETEFKRLKTQCDTSTWTIHDERNFYAMFLHGWYGRANEAAYQKESNAESEALT